MTAKHLKICVLLSLSTCLLCFGKVSLSYGAEKPLIAVVLSSSIEPYREALQGFYDELRSRNIEFASAEVTIKGMDSGDLRLLLKKLNPSLVHAVGTKAAVLAKKEFKDIPIVFSMVLNPVASEVVRTMKSPGENITGASMDIPLDLQFRYLKKILPGVKKIGVVFSESETGVVVKAAGLAAKGRGLELVTEAVEFPGDVPGALGRLVGKVDCLWSVADSKVFTRETAREMLLVSLREKIPFIGLSPSFVKAGALAAFKLDADDIGRQAASITGKVLKGRAPSVMPVSVPRKIKVVLNSNTIKLVGVKIPKDIFASAELLIP